MRGVTCMDDGGPFVRGVVWLRTVMVMSDTGGEGEHGREYWAYLSPYWAYDRTLPKVPEMSELRRMSINTTPDAPS